jgi:hypothetical protein
MYIVLQHYLLARQRASGQSGSDGSALASRYTILSHAIDRSIVEMVVSRFFLGWIALCARSPWNAQGRSAGRAADPDRAATRTATRTAAASLLDVQALIFSLKLGLCALRSGLLGN